MAIKKQLTIYLENKPGQLAKLCKVMGSGKINIIAISVVDTVDTGAVRIVVDNFEKAKKSLNKLGLLIHSRDVLTVTFPNKPGVLAEVAGRLAKAGVNIDYAYGSTHKNSKEAMCVFSVSDPKKAEKILKRS